MSKVKLTAEQKKVVAETMQKARTMSAGDRELFIAKTIGDVYDVELPIPEVIGAIVNDQRAEVGEHVYYLAPDSITKKVNTLTTDCVITQVKVSPNAQTEVTWTDLVSEEVYVCLHDWLKGDHDVLTFNAEAIMEAMDRKEIYSTLALVDAVSDSKKNRSLVFARRKMGALTDMADTTLQEKERVIVSSGNGINVGATRKFAKGFFGAEEISITSINDKTYAQFTRS